MVKSNKYIITQIEFKDIQRKQIDIRKQSLEKLANYIISLGDRILVETMNYKGLQKEVKKPQLMRGLVSLIRRKDLGSL